MKKTFFCFGLMFVMSISAVMAQQYFVAEGINFRVLNDSCVKVVAFDDYNYTGNIVIPETVKNGDNTYSVESIGAYAFSKCSGLVAVQLPNSIKTINDCAFYWCDNLKSLTLPSNLETIGKAAFSHCEKLTDVVIPNSVTEIGYSCFEYCQALKNVTIGSGLKVIENKVFSYCTSLTTIKIPATVERIKDGAFGNSNLTTATFLGKDTKYTDYAFKSTPWFSANSQRSREMQNNSRFKISKKRTITY